MRPVSRVREVGTKAAPTCRLRVEERQRLQVDNKYGQKKGVCLQSSERGVTGRREKEEGAKMRGHGSCKQRTLTQRGKNDSPKTGGGERRNAVHFTGMNHAGDG